MAGKPDITLELKPVSGGDATRVAAFWKEDGGRLSGGFDRKVTAARITYEDGTVVEYVRRNGKGSHWLNAKDWGASGPPRSRSTRTAPPDDDDGMGF